MGKDRQIGGPLQIQDSGLFLRLEIVLETDFLQRLGDLTATIVDALGFADEGNEHVAVSGLIDHDLGVAGGNDLAACPIGGLTQESLDLALPQNFQVGVRFVEQEH